MTQPHQPIRIGQRLHPSVPIPADVTQIELGNHIGNHIGARFGYPRFQVYATRSSVPGMWSLTSVHMSDGARIEVPEADLRFYAPLTVASVIHIGRSTFPAAADERGPQVGDLLPAGQPWPADVVRARPRTFPWPADRFGTMTVVKHRTNGWHFLDQCDMAESCGLTVDALTSSVPDGWIVEEVETDTDRVKHAQDALTSWADNLAQQTIPDTLDEERRLVQTLRTILTCPGSTAADR